MPAISPPHPHLAALRVGYKSYAGEQLVACLDLMCSDGTTVLDPAVNAAMRATLTFASTPATASASGLDRASANFHDVFARLKAGSEMNASDSLVGCTGTGLILGAQTEVWAAGQNGTLGSTYAGATKCGGQPLDARTLLKMHVWLHQLGTLR